MNAQPNTEAKRARREYALHGEVALLRQQNADLLAALKDCEELLDAHFKSCVYSFGYNGVLSTARAAIARAEGRAE